MPKAPPLHKPVKAVVERVHTVQAPDTNYGKGRGGRPWRRKRDRVLKRDLYQCQCCKKVGRVTLATQVDHEIPLFEGGADEEFNLKAICGPCHEAKSKAEAGRGRNGSRFRPRD